jgi:predicted dehydrogenase
VQENQLSIITSSCSAKQQLELKMNPLQVAIIGSGWGVRVQVHAFRLAGWKIGALWVRTKDKIDQFKKELPVELVTDDFEQILRNPEIQLVSIVTPPIAHKEMAIRALKAGKHVLCDKPTALNKEEASQMLACAQQHPQLLSLIDHELRFLPHFIKLREVIHDQNIFGKILRIEINHVMEFGLDRPWSWWCEESSGGGMLGAIGSHQFDLASWFLNDRISELSARLETLIKERPTAPGATTKKPVTADDYYCVNFTTKEKKIPGILISRHNEAPGSSTTRITVHGTNASAEVQDFQILVSFHTGRRYLQFSEPSVPLPLRDNIWAKGTIYFAQKLNDVIRSPTLNHLERANDAIKEAANFYDGLYVQSLLDAARRSSKERKWVAVDC